MSKLPYGCRSHELKGPWSFDLCVRGETKMCRPQIATVVIAANLAAWNTRWACFVVILGTQRSLRAVAIMLRCGLGQGGSRGANEIPTCPCSLFDVVEEQVARHDSLYDSLYDPLYDPLYDSLFDVVEQQVARHDLATGKAVVVVAAEERNGG